ncbi:chromosome segregation protein SMC [Zongyangia hominis]|uniref:Chromosome partition protein Smc n=1 Tax=Zongyangia hominis TaxID=2763677 RepID=A0A926EA48_9FIRM|nr:chromosome segregation protein SMC [Zongyangia hominis]MBC8569258.1 chromosome segregation protein SMC [Zongyangia hominis]
MHLKSLELHGFKSFPDKIKLTFNKGLTAVVGPNGSGKSNISDAIRWVMGEQSTKNLRGAKMEDVIFGGTQMRKPQGFAQVSITIDNSERRIDMDCDEVTVTRKLYRSGESEYRINGNHVRLKDIHEMFMDTGLGRDGYSIIGQGKIAEIISSKSTQRREIFEEAAGISKYRYRKAEAQKQLDLAYENLLRLRDILSELEGRIGPLEIQSQKAQEFLRLSEEKREIEISLWDLQLRSLSSNMRAQDEKILIAQGHYDDVQRQIDALEAQVESLFTAAQQLLVQIDGEKAQMQRLQTQIGEERSQIAVKENDIAHHVSDIASLKESIALSERDSESALSERAAMAGRIEEKKAALEESEREFAAKTQELTALDGEQENLEQTMAALSGDVGQAYRDLSRLELEEASGKSTLEEHKARLQNAALVRQAKERELSATKAQREDCEGVLAGITEEIASLKNAVAGYEYKLQSRTGKLESETAKLEQKKNRHRDLTARIRLLEDLEKNMEGFAYSVKFVMNRARGGQLSGVVGPVSSVISVDSDYAVAVETVLGGSLQNIIVENENVAKRAIALLKEQKAGRTTFYPLSAIKGSRLKEQGLESCGGFVALAADLVECDSRYQGIVDNLLGRIVVVEDLDDAVRMARSYGHRFRIVTLDGQMVNTGGSMTGGSVGKNIGILSRKNEIHTLTRQAEALEKEFGPVEEQLDRYRQAVEELRAMLTGVNSEIITRGEDKIRMESQLIALESRRDQLTAELAALDGDGSDLGASIEALEQRLGELAVKRTEQKEQIDGLEKRQEATSSQMKALEERRAALSGKLGEMRLHILGEEKDIQMLEQTLSQMQQRFDDQEERRNASREQIAAKQAAIEAIRGEIAAIETGCAGMQEQIAALEAQVLEHTKQRQASEMESTRMRTQVRELSVERENHAGELIRLKERGTSLQSEYDAIIAKLWDEYELTRSEAQAQAKEIDKAAGQKRLHEIKSRIKALGSVNVGAIEEYKEVSERYQFMKAQITDVERSREELIRLIDGLTEDMKRQFLQSFQEINRNFSRIFVELFGGGKASLSLTDESDVLECGIDIFVQPPGKIIKNLAALSGGEQAFVAIAIYFAILKVRPSPFCVLDEIEAALDDVNVAKYAGYLRGICDKTQFILITHRRGTMEEADVLYGVTMQEEGVSKLLSIDVSEIENKLGMKANT